MRKRIIGLLVAFTLVFGVSSVIIAAPAQASQSACPAGKYCVWKNGNWYNSPDYYWTIGTGTGGFCVNYGTGLNDQVKSNKTTGGRSVTQYRDANCSGNAVSFIYGPAYGTPTAQRCNDVWSWACLTEAGGGYLPSSAWILR